MLRGNNVKTDGVCVAERKPSSATYEKPAALRAFSFQSYAAKARLGCATAVDGIKSPRPFTPSPEANMRGLHRVKA
jgi:hypothetical protein